MRDEFLDNISDIIGAETKLEDLDSDVIVHSSWIVCAAMEAPRSRDGSVRVGEHWIMPDDTVGDLIEAIRSQK